MNIMLNCFPPASTQWPSLSLSILKSFMANQGHQVNIKYWNFVLEDYQIRFFGNKADVVGDSYISLIPFINYFWVHSGEKTDKKNWKYQLLSMNPRWYNFESDYTDNKMIQYSDELEQIITNEIMKMNLDTCQVFGITTKFHQWLSGGIVAQKVKEMFPEIKIVIGGLGTSDEALAMMNNFAYYDYAIWGEGEYPLLHLCEALLSGSDTEIPYLIYRNHKGNPQINQLRKKEFLDLNTDIFPDYTDFFSQITKNRSIYSLPFERSRGCHWNKCKFCYLNDGYRFRTKTNETIIKELNHQIEKYHTRSFSCLDNDMIGKDINVFEELLDGLIVLKEKYNDFSIHSVEVITKDTNSSIIKKMVLGGVRHVQIGYESSSNRLLQKNHKKNTFASNLLFIKWAKEFSISITGLNVIQGLLEETIDDIYEATDNLYHLRFFLSKKVIKHNATRLTISKSSPYYKEIADNNNLADWIAIFFQNMLPDNFCNRADMDKHCLFQYASIYPVTKQWEYFYKAEEHYIKSHYDYQIIQNKNRIHYREYFNNALINELVFEDPLHWEILKSCNHHVSSLKEICTNSHLSSQNDIISAIESLRCEGLLYHNEDFSEIITPVNTDIVL